MPGKATSRFSLNELAKLGIVAIFLRLDAGCQQRRLEAKAAEMLHGMWQHVQADSERHNLRGGFVDLARQSGAMKGQRQHETAYASADDENVLVGVHGCEPSRCSKRDLPTCQESRNSIRCRSI